MLQVENLDLLSDEDSDAERCDPDFGCQSAYDKTSEAELSLQSIVEQRYLPEIRKLYYTLLADQVPVSKISDIIRAVLRCFNPSMNIEQLRLPQKTCQLYGTRRTKDHM